MECPSYPGSVSPGATLQLNNVVHEHHYDPIMSEQVYLQQKSQSTFSTGPFRSSFPDVSDDKFLGSKMDDSDLPLPPSPVTSPNTSYSSPNRYPLREISPNPNYSIPVKSTSTMTRRGLPYPGASYLPRPILRQASNQNVARPNGFGNLGFPNQFPLQQVPNVKTRDQYRPRQCASNSNLTQQKQYGFYSSRIPRYLQPHHLPYGKSSFEYNTLPAPRRKRVNLESVADVVAIDREVQCQLPKSKGTSSSSKNKVVDGNKKSNHRSESEDEGKKKKKKP